MRALAGEILPGGRRLARQHVVDDTLHHHLAAMHARAGPHLHDVVGGANGVLVMLHHDHRVADVAQALQRRDHLHVVLRVQADARLVEHVEHAHQARTDLRGQAYALRLAAGERAGAAIEAEVIEPDAEQQLQPAADFAQHLAAGIGAAARRFDGAQERVQLVEVELARRRRCVLPSMVNSSRVARTRAPLQSGQVCSTITLSSHASMPELASPRWR